MPKIDVNEGLFFKALGRKLEKAELVELLTAAKAELDDWPQGEGVLRIELNDTNRPDLWSTMGLARQLSIYLGGKVPSYLFEFDGRINRAKVWLALLVIVCWMIVLAMLMLIVDQAFGNPVKSIHFNVNDIFAFIDPAVLRAAIARVRRARKRLRPISFWPSFTRSAR